MEKEFIPYEQALALKELGFEEEYLDFYDDNKELFYNHENKEKVHIGDSVKAPLYQQAFRWFREKYGLELLIAKDDIEQYYFSVKKSEALFDEYDYCFTTYEKAELECLKKLIEIVKEKK